MNHDDMKPKTLRAILFRVNLSERKLDELESKSYVLLWAILGCLLLNIILMYRILQ